MNTQGIAWLTTAAGRRFGLKGPQAATELARAGLSVPPQPNTWVSLRAGDPEQAGSIVGRLGATEFFIEEAGDAATIADLLARLEQGIAGAYPVLREDCALVLGGAAAGDVLAQVCNVDLPALDTTTRPVVMTLMIGVGVLVLPQASPDGTIYRIWCDPSFGAYLRQELEEIITRIATGRAQ